MTPEIISLIASITSVILAVGAIWLSITFYRMSSAASKATEEAAKGISASVERLEKLFDKLYSDTFSMMRDTVSAPHPVSLSQERVALRTILPSNDSRPSISF